ncbi:MAG: hypothetical protein WA981_10170 [Glaciecola sp.]
MKYNNKIITKILGSIALVFALSTTANATLIQQSISFDGGQVDFAVEAKDADLFGSFYLIDEITSVFESFTVVLDAVSVNATFTDMTDVSFLDVAVNDPRDGGIAAFEFDVFVGDLAVSILYDTDFDFFDITVIDDFTGDLLIGEELSASADATPSAALVNAPTMFALTLLFGGLVLARKKA